MNWTAFSWCAGGLLLGTVGGTTISSVVFYNTITQPPPAHTVAWYKEHPTDRIEQLAICNNNPGEGQHDPNCTNADTADMKASFDSFADKLHAVGQGK